jgi:hypothetical protein
MGPIPWTANFTPKGKKKWGPYRLNHKIQKLGKAIAKIGRDKSSIPPVLVGLAEVENKTVLAGPSQSRSPPNDSL